MAVITITSSSVVWLDGPVVSIPAGETIAAGDICYFDPSELKAFKADCTTLTKSGAGNSPYFKIMMAISGGNRYQPLNFALPGSRIQVGAVLTSGRFWYLSATPGKICLFSDLVNGNYNTLLGDSESTSILNFWTDITGIQLSAYAASLDFSDYRNSQYVGIF